MSRDSWEQVGERTPGERRCSGTLTSDGSRVRIITVGPGSCALDFDVVWRTDGDTFMTRIVGVVDPEGWTLQNWQNEKAWV